MTDFYHYALMHPLKNFCTALSGAPQKCFKSGPALANAGPECTTLINVLAPCWDFSAPPSVSAPGTLCSPFPLVTPLIWYRNRILERNVEALITCKINTDFSCCDFQENITSNKDVLKKVLSTEKYCWANV